MKKRLGRTEKEGGVTHTREPIRHQPLSITAITVRANNTESSRLMGASAESGNRKVLWA
jgi:hypothetical protein